MTELILASTSPYRKELLSRLGLCFTAIAPAFDEDAYKTKGLPPGDLAPLLAKGKAESLASNTNCVIGGDQIAHLEGKILGKPKTLERAIEQLSLLNGKTHELLTAVHVSYQGQSFPHLDVTRLTMRKLSHQQIKDYVEADRPLDAAGSYKIETRGICLFERIESQDFTAIQGLPLIWLTKILAELEYPI